MLSRLAVPLPAATACAPAVPFNSLEFLLFAGLFFPAFHLLRRQRDRLLWLCAASFFFYGFWDARFLLLLLFNGYVNFRAALALVDRPRRRRLLLGAALLANLGTLFFFKYFGFAFRAASDVAGLFGLGPFEAPFDVLLPVGISFYTFQSMSYTIDVYRGQVQPTRSLLLYFAYLAMFPQLVAGPILRASALLPQLTERRSPTEARVWEGWQALARGFFKKCFVADNLAPVVNAAFASDAAALPPGAWWLVALLFSVQIYCDFSGYSDIATGLGRWMGLDYPPNFNHPLNARSFRSLWARWHISLSSWFRDYVYIPLGGNRHGAARAQLHLWITMMSSALWHGANWTFLVWGAIHAAALSLERLTAWPDRLVRRCGWLGLHLAQAIVLLVATYARVWFRADSAAQAWAITARMLDLPTLIATFGDSFALMTGTAAVALAAVVARHAYAQVDARRRLERILPMTALRIPAAAALVAIAIFFRGPAQEFIYFQF